VRFLFLFTFFFFDLDDGGFLLGIFLAFFLSADGEGD
jgi:hypothetical protein